MPPPSSRMTKNRAQPTRYRPGKAEAADPESDEESSEEEEEDDERPTAAAAAAAATTRAPPPKATTFPRKLAVDVSKAGQQVSRPAAPQAKPPDEDLEGFVTASESSEDEDGARGSGDDSGSEEDGSEEEDSSSDDEPAKPMIRPTFISKAKRAQQQQQPSATNNEEEKAAGEETLRKEKADALLAAHLARDAAARAAGKKYWDDDDIAPEDEVDDTDDVDPEAELAAWKLRELKRVRRDRAAIEEKEKEREEVERRRGLTAEEREEEDRRFIEAQKEGREEGRGKMGFMQKYFHKGAFFGGTDGGDGEDVDEEVAAALNRDLAGATFEDEAGDKSLLPEYMRMRDMTRLGRKGRSKYKDLKSEDTGRWGAEVGRRRKKREFDGEGLDERFRPDDERDGEGGGKGREGPTGANSAAMGERKRARYE